MNYIDTHCHIYMEKFDTSIDEIVNNAKNNNVTKLICIGVDLDSSLKCVDLAEKYDEIYATVGIHPHESDKVGSNYLNEIRQIAIHPKVVAIGEIGLDYHYSFSKKINQKKVFQDQIFLAKELNLPIVVHNRNSDLDLYQILLQSNHAQGVIHCFTSTLNFAKKIIDLGFYISFTGIITFSLDLEKVVKGIPLEKILLETDSPYLSPKPLRGKKNQPMNIPIIAEKVSELKKIPINTVANITSSNAHLLFTKL